MPIFARETTVPVERSKAEIEQILTRYGASAYQSGWNQDSAMIMFRLRDLFIRFVLPLPKLNERRFTHKKDRSGYEKKRTEQQVIKEWNQEIRQRWRVLALVIKAKLEAVEGEISTVESEFLANIVMPNDTTVGQWIIEQSLPAIRSGQMPLALTGPPSDPIVDAEFEEKPVSK